MKGGKPRNDKPIIPDVGAQPRWRFEQSRIALVRMARRVDAFCARLNAGLAAVTIALTLVVVVLGIARHPEISYAEYDASVAAVGGVDDTSSAFGIAQ